MKNASLIIKKKYLIFRDEINYLKKIIKKEKNKSIYLDFSKVSFFSRSFGDELLNMLEDFRKNNSAIKIINLKPKLKIFLKRIEKRKKQIKKEVR